MFFPILIETTQYQQWKYFVLDYLQQNKDGFFENENYKSLTIIIFFSILVWPNLSPGKLSITV